jgi:dCMP deaminase
MRGAITALREELALADCSRRRVGAVIMTLDGEIVGRGHNRLPEGSCLDGQCPRGKLTYDQQPKDVGYEESGCIALHAEWNALASAGSKADGAVMFVTEMPCPGCRDLIVASPLYEVKILNPERIGKFQAPV